MACCDRFTTPTNPNFKGYTLPFKMSTALVPWSIKSILDKIPTVLLPVGSTSRANLRDSEFTKSTLAGSTAKMIRLGLEMYLKIKFRVCFSMSVGWSPMGILVRPGKSTKVKFKTRSE